MAESITIKALQDASLDAKSLEEVVNGNDTKQVTTRLGENYPSVKKAIKTLFENGGLPAEPFATKALMTASALVDGKYAQVTDDTVNNGLYVKAAGAWVKSAYDPVVQANAYADANKNSALKESFAYTNFSQSVNNKSKLTSVIELSESATGYYEKTGVFKSDSTISTSDFISVKKGECYVLTDMKEDAGTLFSYALFNSSKEFVGVMSGHRARLNYYDNEQKLFSNGVGRFNTELSLNTSGAIVPIDGFIKVSYKLTGASFPSNSQGNEVRLLKTGFREFVKMTSTSIPDEYMFLLDGVVESVIIDKNLVGGGISATQTVGSPVSFSGVNHSISKRYPVSAGQFIHLHTISSTSYSDIVFEDEDGNYLGSAYPITEFSLGTSTHSSKVLTNVKSNFTGYFRVHSYELFSSPFLVGVTDASIDFPINYLTGETQTISFNPELGSTVSYKISDNFSSTSIFSTMQSQSNVESSHTASIPYVLKRGDVIEYSLEATNSPLLAMVVERGKDIGNVSLLNSRDIAVPLLATEVVSIKQTQAWLQQGKPTTANYFANASKGTIAYCNEDTDVVIVFYRPNKLNKDYKKFKQSQEYSVNLLTKEQYITKRDKNLKERFKKISGFKVNKDASTGPLQFNIADGGRASFSPVLMFKGEVVNYMTNGFAESSTRHLSDVGVANNFKPYFSNIAQAYLAPLSPDVTSAKLSLPVRQENPASTIINQVYCHETGVVYLGLVYLTPDYSGDLDPENIIKDVKFTPKIVKLRDAVIGVDIEPCTLRGNQSKYSEDIKLFSTTLNGIADSMATFLGKGRGLESTYWSNSSQQVVVKSKLSPSANNDITPVPPTPVYNPEGTGEYTRRLSQGMPCKIGFVADEDLFVAVSSVTKSRNQVDMFTDGNQEALNVLYESVPDNVYNMEHFYTLSMRGITPEKVNELYKVTDKTFFDIPDIKDVSFNFCTLVHSGISSHYSLLQILIAGKVVLTLNALTENQGQSTAYSLRRNVNIEMFNDKFEKVYVTFGGAIEQNEIVLKSYLNTDRGHFKDTTANDLWYQMRHADPYPVGGVIPNYLFEDLTTPSNQVARASTFAFPVTHNRGDQFYGMATLKFKKKRENYAMTKNNPNHILLQADWEIGGAGQFSWVNPSLTKMEVRNPSISGYEPGDATLPVKFIEVENNINRILNWLRDVHTGTVDARDTYQDFVNLDSLIDYSISVAVTYNVDGRTNNFMMGTHNGTIWDFYSYDTDQTWGAMNNVKVDHSRMMSNDLFSSVLTILKPEVEARYAKQRKLGIIDTKRIQSEMVSLNNFTSVSKKLLDIKYWGVWDETAGLPYTMKWVRNRIAFLDAYFGYIDESENVIHQNLVSAYTIKPNESKVFTYNDTNAKAGDFLMVQTGNDLGETSLTVACEADGVLVITHYNPTEVAIRFENTYLQTSKY